MKKTLVLSSDELKKLNLKYGENTIDFWLTTMLQGTTKISASIYLWNSTDNIVISDIDGTITKSDVMGNIFPAIGKDCSQKGVTHLYPWNIVSGDNPSERMPSHFGVKSHQGIRLPFITSGAALKLVVSVQ